MDGFRKIEIKRTRKRKAIVVYSKDHEMGETPDLDDNASLLNDILSSGSKGKELLRDLSGLNALVNGVKINHAKMETMRRLAGRFMILMDTDLRLQILAYLRWGKETRIYGRWRGPLGQLKHS
ncbi:hypothetical protein OXIME_001676 [Oxyplasma meridianum]|uniref:Uncharacterized protein n=1 Tax=Oxyplasma meridianum TaxID=3073602 RepID=A0AAX4NHX8_9ARCH